jgi:uncharacterized protein (TIGR03067 family)
MEIGMRQLSATILGLVAVVMVSIDLRADEKTVQEEMKALEGKWEAVVFEVGGRQLPDEYKPKIEIKGNKMAGWGEEKTFTIDPSKSPRHIDFTAKSKQGKSFKTPGLYQFENGELLICVLSGADGVDRDRPKSMKTEGTVAALLRLKKVK